MAHKRRLTPGHILSFPNVSDAQIDPSGQTIAFVRGELVRENTKLPRQHIWLVDTNAQNERQFTHGPRTDSSPRWSPDGTQIAFFSDRIEDGQLQIFLIDRAGGEAVCISELRGEIDTSGGKDALQWSPDGSRLAFTMMDAESEEEKKRKETKDDAIEFEKVHKYTRVWTLDITTRRLSRVSQGRIQVWEFQWSSDGLQFALIVSDLPYEWSWYHARLARVSTSGGKPRTIYKPRRRQLALPRWSPDRKSIAFLSSVWSDRGICQGGAFLMVLRRRNLRELASAYPGSFGCLAWTKDGRSLLTAGHELGQATLGRIDIRSGETTSAWRQPLALAEPGWPYGTISAAHRRITVVRHGPHEARNVWCVDLGSKREGSIIRWHRLTNAVPTLREFALGKQEIIQWTSRDGLT